MNKIKNFNLKKFLTLIAALTLALCLAFSVACGGNTTSGSTDSDSDDDDEAVVNPTDYQTVKNGDFEFGTFGDSVSYPVYTGVNWTKYRDNSYSTSAISSSKNSGIIDTEDEAYNEIASAQKFPTLEGSEEYWNPRTPAYYGFGGQRYEEEDFESNPNEDKLVTKGSKILMIHNVSSESGRGTAQKFVSSSSLTTTTGYGKLSVWVLTKDLKTLQQTDEFGAYISVNSTLSSSRSPFLVKNINTNGLWAEYVIYLKTSDYAKSSFTVTVGLGFGSDTYMAEYVEGFAYFDDIHYEEIDKAVFDEETATNDGEYSLFDADNNETTKKDVTVKTNEKAYEYGVENTETKAYKYKKDGDKNVAKTVKYVYSHLMDTTAPTLTFTGEFNTTVNNEGSSGFVAFNSDTFTSLNLGVENTYAADALTAYINLTKASSYTLTSDKIKIEKNDYMQFNFLAYVKIDTLVATGATVQVEEVDENGNVLGDPIDVATDFVTYDETDKDYTWKKISVFVSNNLNLKGDTNTDRYIRFKFTLGTTEIADFNQGNYDNVLTKGFALFTGFEQRVLPEEEYGIVSSEADYKSTITLGNEFPNGPETDDDEEETTDYAFTSSASTEFDIKKQPATQVNEYTGVVAGHTMVGGTNKEYSLTNVTSGVVSSKYASTYEGLSEVATALDTLKTDDAEIQPLLIKNTTSAAYGYLGSKLTLSANTTTLISVEVKVLSGTAYVYLVNADPLSNFDVLNVTIDKKEDGTTSKQLYTVVTKDNFPTNADKWVTVNFLVTTGDEDISYRVELWNGSRDGQVQSQGTVLFNHVNVTTSTTENQLLSKLGDPNPTVSEQHTRATATVTYTDTSETDKNGDPVEKTYQLPFKPVAVYKEYANESTIIASYETIHAPLEIDETTSTDDDTDDDDSDSASDEEEVNDYEKANWALQLTSIIIAAILVVVLIVVLIRMLVKKNKGPVYSKDNNFDKNSRQSSQANINQNKAKRAQQELENANNDAKAKTEEEPTAEQPVEEETIEDKVEETENAEEQPVEEETEDSEETVEEKPYDYTNPENNI